MCQHVGLAYFEVSEVDSSFCHGRAALQSGSQIAYPSQFLSSILPRPLSPPEWAVYQLFFFATFPFDYTRLDKQYQRTVTCVPRWNSWVTSPLPPLCSPRVPAIGGFLQQRRRGKGRPNNTPSTIQGWTLTASEQWMEGTVLLPRFTCGRHWELSRKGMLTLHWQAYGCRKKIIFSDRRLFPSAFTMQHHTLHA